MTLWDRLAQCALIVAVLATAGCRSSGEPLGLLLHGTFVLRTVNGAALPADVSISPSYQMTLLADTLRFEGKGLAKMGRTERLQPSTLPPTVVHFTLDFAVRIVGETIYLKFLCPFGAFCISTAEISGHLVDGNTLMLDGAQPYVYVRP